MVRPVMNSADGRRRPQEDSLHAQPNIGYCALLERPLPGGLVVCSHQFGNPFQHIRGSQEIAHFMTGRGELSIGLLAGGRGQTHSRLSDYDSWTVTAQARARAQYTAAVGGGSDTRSL